MRFSIRIFAVLGWVTLLEIGALAQDTPALTPELYTNSPSDAGYNPVNARASTWDLNLSLGFLRGINAPFLGERTSSFDLRIQTGVLFVNGSWFYGVGPFIEYAPSFSSQGSDTSLGLLAYFSDAQAGGWVELGAFRSFSPSMGFLGSIGWSIFGLEFQTRKLLQNAASQDWFALFKLRIPVSALIYLIQN